MCSCGGCLDTDDKKGSSRISIESVQTPFAIDLDKLYGRAFSYQTKTLVSVPFILKNDDPFQDAGKKDLDKVTLRITNRQNVAQVLYVTKVTQSNLTTLVPQDYSVIDDYAITLAELFGVLDEVSIHRSKEKKLLIAFEPQDIAKPASFVLELEGSKGSSISQKVQWRASLF